MTSDFAADPRKMLAKWRNARRRRKLDPAVRERDSLWAERGKQIKRAEPLIEEAGFNLAAHYFPGGVPSYCMCGAVADHNAAFDKLLEDPN